MANVKEKVLAEIDNIEKVLVELKKVKDRSNKELVVLVGLGAYLQNIYNGMENILKQLLLFNNISIPETPSWHKDLLNLSVKHHIITLEMTDKIGRYLCFRHFLTHSYGFLIEESKLKSLMDNISNVYSEFKREISDYLTSIEKV